MQTRGGTGTLATLLAQPGYQSRFKDVLRDRAPQFISSLIQVGNSLGPDCDPLSIISGAMTAASLDLPINKNLGFAWLVPFKERGVKKAQFQMGYKGYIQLALRTGQYARMNAGPINAECLGGWDKVGERVLDFSKYLPDAPAAAYFLAFEMTSGFTKVAVWTRADVEAHAKQYSQSYRGGYDSPWKSHFDQMATKTVIANELRQWGIMSVEMQRALETDGAVVQGLDNPTIEFPDAPIKVVEIEHGGPTNPVTLESGDDAPPMDSPTPLAQPQEPEPAAKAPAKPITAPKPGPLDNGERLKQNAAAATQAPAQAQIDPTATTTGTSQAQLEKFVTDNGYNWDTFSRFAEGAGLIPDCSSLSGFGELGGPLASRMLRAKAGILIGLKDTAAMKA